MNNYILKNENAIYYECGYSCDNVIFIKLHNEAFFITDARYTIEANAKVKNAQVIQTADLISQTKKILKKSKIKKIVFDGNDFNYSTYNALANSLKIKFVNKPNFSQQKRMIKSDDEIELLHKASKLGRDGFKNFAKHIKQHGLNQNEKLLHLLRPKK